MLNAECSMPNLRGARMRSHRLVVVAVIALLMPVAVSAQWLNYPTPGVPRLPDGKANLAAPAPKTADGKPDLSGIWSGAGPMYRFNIAQDLETKDVQPWAEKLFLQRVRERSEEHTSELQSLRHLVCRLLLEKKKNTERTKLNDLYFHNREADCEQVVDQSTLCHFLHRRCSS